MKSRIFNCIRMVMTSLGFAVAVGGSGIGVAMNSDEVCNKSFGAGLIFLGGALAVNGVKSIVCTVTNE